MPCEGENICCVVYCRQRARRQLQRCRARIQRPPIVSKRVKQVVDENGIPLFDCSTAGARRTPTGKEFVDDARRILQNVDRTLSEQWRKQRANSDVVVGFPWRLLIGFERLPRALSRNRGGTDQNPVIELTADGLSGAIYIALIFGDTRKCEVLDSIAVWSKHLVVALPALRNLLNDPFGFRIGPRLPLTCGRVFHEALTVSFLPWHCHTDVRGQCRVSIAIIIAASFVNVPDRSMILLIRHLGIAPTVQSVHLAHQHSSRVTCGIEIIIGL